MKEKKSIGFYIGTLFCLLMALMCLLPLVYMLLMSFTQSSTTTLHLKDVNIFDIYNYGYALSKRGFAAGFKNSIIVTVGSCLLVNLVSAMAAYGFEKKPLPGKEKLFQLYLSTMMIPGQVVLISMFVMVNKAGMSNTYSAVILPMVGAFGIFLMRQFMEAVPNDLLEAAEIDGSGELRTFFTIVLPLVQPALITLTVFTFTSSWNNFLWPLIITNKSEMFTLTLTMSTLSGRNDTNYGLVMAGATLTFLFPFILYLFMQKQFVEGIALGGVKG